MFFLGQKKMKDKIPILKKRDGKNQQRISINSQDELLYFAEYEFSNKLLF